MVRRQTANAGSSRGDAGMSKPSAGREEISYRVAVAGLIPSSFVFMFLGLCQLR